VPSSGIRTPRLRHLLEFSSLVQKQTVAVHIPPCGSGRHRHKNHNRRRPPGAASHASTATWPGAPTPRPGRGSAGSLPLRVPTSYKQTAAGSRPIRINGRPYLSGFAGEMKRLLLAHGQSGCPSRSLVGRNPALPVLCNNVLPDHRVSSPICQSLLLLSHVL
jgi:hypothetical protein